MCSPQCSAGHTVVARFCPSFTDRVVKHIRNGNVGLSTLLYKAKISQTETLPV